MKTFMIVWIGQSLSLIGSELTGFALGIWVYQQNGSATEFAIISLCTLLPTVLISPISGVFLDRWNRRHVMILSDIGAGVSTLSIALLLFTGHLSVTHIYGLTAIASIFGGFQKPALVATSSLLLPKDKLIQGSGLMSMSIGLASLIAPVLGGVLLSLIQLQGIMAIDFVTFLVGVVTLGIVRFPPVPRQPLNSELAGNETAWETFWAELTCAWIFLRQRPGLLGLLGFFCGKNILQGMILVLMTPLALSFTTPKVLGIVLSIGGIGMIVGSSLLPLVGRQKRRTSLIFVFTLLLGLSIFSAGLRVSVPLFAIATFLYSLALPFIHGPGQVIFQLKTPADLQGRVFSFNEAVSGLAVPCGYIIAGPLSDHIFEPLMAVGGPLSGVMGPLIGVGPGRGIGLLFMVIGILHGLLSWVSYRYRPLRYVERLIPDVLPTEQPTTEALPAYLEA